MIFKDEEFIVRDVKVENHKKILLLSLINTHFEIFPKVELKGSWSFTPVLKGNKVRILGEFTN